MNAWRRCLPWLLAAGVITCGCSKSTDAESLDLRVAEHRVDLTDQLPGEWDRVCVLAPYSTDRHARQVLGIDAEISLHSRIVYSDSIALLVTVRDAEVAGLFEIARDNVDFAHLGGECFVRGESTFAIPDAGHPYATHVDT